MTDQFINHTAFQALMDDKKLMASQCSRCKSVYLPPRPLCIDCYCDELEWIEVPDKGELAAFTIIHIAPTAMLEAGYGRDNPYCSGIVRLNGGQMISAQILDVDIENPQNIQIGTQLSLELIERDEGDQTRTYLAYKPTK